MKGPSPVLYYFVCFLYSWFILQCPLQLHNMFVVFSWTPGYPWQSRWWFWYVFLAETASWSSHPFSSLWENSWTLSQLPLFLSVIKWMIAELRCATPMTWFLKFSYAQSPMLFPIWPLSIRPWKLHLERARRWKEPEHHLEESHPPIRSICFEYLVSEK